MATKAKKTTVKEQACATKTVPDAACSESAKNKKKSALASTSGASASGSTCSSKVEVSRTASAKPTLDRAVIAHRAWEIWQREGCPEGKDLEHWLKAEKELGCC